MMEFEPYSSITQYVRLLGSINLVLKNCEVDGIVIERINEARHCCAIMKFLSEFMKKCVENVDDLR